MEIIDFDHEEHVEEMFCQGILNDFIHRNTVLDGWVNKFWDIRHIQYTLSVLLKCDTSDWGRSKLCNEVKKLYPTIHIKPDWNVNNKYWIKYKFPYEIENDKYKSNE